MRHSRQRWRGLADLDLAKPRIGYALPKQPVKNTTEPDATNANTHEVQAPPQNDSTVAVVATLLLAGAGAPMIWPKLAPFGVTLLATEAAVALGNRGTVHRPNRVVGTLDTATTKGVRDTELFYRAAYICNAAKRITESLREGLSIKEAIKREMKFWRQHERARKQRLQTIKQVTETGRMYGIPTDEGTLVGWYKNPMLNNESECNAADGHNFYVEKGTVIGYPGSVHFGCGCKAGPPIDGAEMVDDAIARQVKLVPGPEGPKFKLKKRWQ